MHVVPIYPYFLFESMTPDRTRTNQKHFQRRRTSNRRHQKLTEDLKNILQTESGRKSGSKWPLANNGIALAQKIKIVILLAFYPLSYSKNWLISLEFTPHCDYFEDQIYKRSISIRSYRNTTRNSWYNVSWNGSHIVELSFIVFINSLSFQIGIWLKLQLQQIFTMFPASSSKISFKVDGKYQFKTIFSLADLSFACCWNRDLKWASRGRQNKSNN